LPDVSLAQKAQHLSDYVRITSISAQLRQRLNRARVGHFATTDGSRPTLVPVCFVLLEHTFYHAIDAKPKAAASRQLQRVRNLLTSPQAALLVDHYEEDWRRLWFALAHGRARLLERGPEHDRAIRALRRKYGQYRTTTPLDAGALVIALDAERLRHWRSSSSARGRAAHPGRPA
jgi:PPOX class probable F420-dependent enzyme